MRAPAPAEAASVRVRSGPAPVGRAPRSAADGRAPFHTLALCAWLGTAMLPSLLTSNPVYLGVALLMIVHTQRTVTRRSRAGAAWGAFARFALFFVLFTLAFNVLMGGAGETVLVELPAWRVTGENGATLFQVGGALTAESLVSGLLRAGAMLVVIFALAIFNSLADQSQMLRGLPRWLDQATTVVTIAVTFMPQLVAAQRDIREALALRGYRMRRLRDFLPLILVLLGEALERAMGLAESMEARGYSGPAPGRGERRRPRLLIAAGLLLLGTGAVAGDLGLGTAADGALPLAVAWPQVVMVLGMLSILAALRLVGRRGRRRRYRRELWRPRDSGLTCLSLVASATWLVLYFQDRAPFFYPVLSAPHRARHRDSDPAATARPPRSLGFPAGRAHGVCVLIKLRALTYRYPDAAEPVIRGLDLHVEESELLLVAGPSGSGKSSLLRVFNGLVPHFHGGTVGGEIRVAGRDPIELGPRGMSDLVGFVHQNPEAHFVTNIVEDELAFAMENHGVDPATMRRRVEEVLDQLAIAHLRYRDIDTLSGGERQRVAIAGVLTLQPRILVLDEPTSQLDPQSASEVLAALRTLNDDLGLTLVLAEHRLDRVAQHADRVLLLDAGKGHGARTAGRGVGRLFIGAAPGTVGTRPGLAGADADAQGNTPPTRAARASGSAGPLTARGRDIDRRRIGPRAAGHRGPWPVVDLSRGHGGAARHRSRCTARLADRPSRTQRLRQVDVAQGPGRPCRSRKRPSAIAPDAGAQRRPAARGALRGFPGRRLRTPEPFAPALPGQRRRRARVEPTPAGPGRRRGAAGPRRMARRAAPRRSRGAPSARAEHGRAPTGGARHRLCRRSVDPAARRADARARH